MPDNINHPDHYTFGGVECIDAIRAALGDDRFLGYCEGNALKYLWRWRDKGGLEDLEKAAWYIEKMRSVLNDNDGFIKSGTTYTKWFEFDQHVTSATVAEVLGIDASKPPYTYGASGSDDEENLDAFASSLV